MKLTIILPLKDRVAFTYRWMRYMNDMRCPYRILIADGGEDIAIERHLRNHGNYPNLDYEYIRYPYDVTIETFLTKLEDVISRVKSEYLLHADNDDFFLLDRIPAIIAFLDTHKDYVGARGNLVNLILYDRSGVPSAQTLDARYLALDKEAPSIENECPCERVESLCKDMSTHDYYMNWYCIFRSASYQEVWKSLITLPIKEMIVVEVLTHVLLLMNGKIKIMPFNFYIRQSNPFQVGGMLVVGNEFLERCIVNNALSDFGVALEQFVVVQTRGERERLLRAIAAWLEVFVSNIYWGRVRMRKSILFRIRRKIRHVPWFGWWIAQIYYRMPRLFLPLRQRRLANLKSIEPYILS